MKIAHYMTGIDSPGGVAAYIRRVVAAQRRRGDEVLLFDRGGVSTPEVYHTRDDQDLFDNAELNALDVLHLHTAIESAPRKTVPLVRTVHGHRPYCPSGGRFLARRGEPCPRALSLTGCTWGHLVDHCGSVRPARFIDDFRQTSWERRLLDRIPVIAVSEFVREQMVRSGYCHQNIDVLLHPATVPSTAPLPVDGGIPRFVFLGRMVESKGIFWLLRATARVQTPIALDIAGSGPAEEPARQLARELGVIDRIRFHGWVEERTAFELIAAARAVVFPSVWPEPAGLVTLEAAAHGCAVIASRVGGIPQYAQAIGNAVLVDVNDEQGLAAQIDRLASDSSLADQLGAAGYTAVMSRFTMAEHIEKLAEVYRKSLERLRAGDP
jgi:glycosyltransferase involved in cell wall biosynthesis